MFCHSCAGRGLQLPALTLDVCSGCVLSESYYGASEDVTDCKQDAAGYLEKSASRWRLRHTAAMFLLFRDADPGWCRSLGYHEGLTEIGLRGGMYGTVPPQ